MMKSRGFTLLELILVVIIVGILASLGMVSYTKVMERSRSAEAREALGMIRTAEEAYKMDNPTVGYSNVIADVGVGTAVCDATHYFKYTITTAGGPPTTSFTATATRCIAADGVSKAPVGTTAWWISLNDAGTISTGGGY